MFFALLILSLLLISSVFSLAIDYPSGSKIKLVGNSASIEIIYPEPVFCSIITLVKQGSTNNILQNPYTCPTSIRCGDVGRTSFNFTQSFSSEGIYIFKIEAQDCVGNRRLDNFTINVTSVKAVGCGDGVKSGVEECDDGNLVFGDGCSQSCKSEVCGNNRVDANEICDGNLLSGRSCQNFTSPLGFKFTGGKLLCNVDCKSFNTLSCTPLSSNSSLCGNGILDVGETCDLSKSGALLSGVKTCNALNANYTSGSLSCNSACKFDLASCIGKDDSDPVCGDGILEPTEECESNNIKSCAALGFLSGTTSCKNCKINTSSCTPTIGTPKNGTCGDGLLSTGESCDYSGSNVLFPKNSSCVSYSSTYKSGVLTCNKPTCSVNTSACVLKNSTGTCGNFRFDVGEECDGSAKKTCKELGFIGGTISCSDGCNHNTSKCIENKTGIITPNPVCGNGIIESGEQCDGLKWGKYTDCKSFDARFKGGLLSCDPKKCTFITSACEGLVGGTCGDNQLAVGEQCDGTVSKTCSDFGNFIAGSLSCASCTYDTSSCRKPNPICGDSELNFGEECDGDMFDGDISSCQSLDSFSSGNLACTSECKTDLTSCGQDSELDITCTNKIKDEFESDVDCGSSCACCDVAKKCSSNIDCCSGFCTESGVCAEAKCDDGIKNGAESGVDCGGSCDNKCQDGAPCFIGSDCQSSFCLEGSCVTPSCDDGYQNGLESDVDCSGDCDNKCSVDQRCTSSIDCASGLCEYGLCTVDKSLDSDGDGMPDFWEDKFGFDKFDPSDASEDADSDDLTNLEEFLKGTDPTIPDISNNPGPSVPLLASGLSLLGVASGFLWYYATNLKPKMSPFGALKKQNNSAQQTQQASNNALANNQNNSNTSNNLQNQRFVSSQNTSQVPPAQSKKAMLLRQLEQRKKSLSKKR